MAILVIAEHDNATLKGATLNVVTAAAAIGGDVNVLVAGSNCGAVAEAAAKIAGVSKVLVADNAAYAHQLAENVSLLVTELAGDYDHIIATALTTGKNFMPRVAALLDVAQISDIIGKKFRYELGGTSEPFDYLVHRNLVSDTQLKKLKESSNDNKQLIQRLASEWDHRFERIRLSDSKSPCQSFSRF